MSVIRGGATKEGAAIFHPKKREFILGKRLTFLEEVGIMAVEKLQGFT